MRPIVELGVFASVFLLGVRLLAFAYGYPARALYDGELAAQERLASGMSRWTDGDSSRDQFSTGSARFDGEWLFATHMMGSLGFSQLALQHPERGARYAEAADRSIDVLVSARGRAFDHEAWGRDPLQDLGSGRDHVAYLGYLALAASLARMVNPESRHAELEQRVIEHLVARFEQSPNALLETYPGEMFPIDNTSFFGALAVHDRVTGEDHRALLDHLLEQLQRRYRDPHTGLLYQAVDPTDGTPIDAPRGSGTALAAYFLSFADPAVSRSLYQSMQEQLLVRTLGFGTTREYPSAAAGGMGDIDSGPVVLGQGVSATGFTLALARIHADRETFVATYATASFFGGPVAGNHALGGPIGDGLLFALTTALPARTWAEMPRPGS